jgi:hypothetical protein
MLLSTTVPPPPDYELTKYLVGDHSKFGTFWQGPLIVVKAHEKPTKDTYTLRNLVSGNEARAHVTHLKPFVYDLEFTTPLNVAVKDTEEFVVDDILS